MAQLTLVKTQGGALLPLTEQDRQVVDRRRIGSVFEGNFRAVRNPHFHRKFFALLNLGFDYWQPTGGAVTPGERTLLDRFCRFLAHYGGELSTLQDAASGFFDHVANNRGDIGIVKSFDAYRKWVVAEAGYYEIVTLPNGMVRKEARSISFARMDDDEFAELYKAAFNVLWTYILSRSFANRAEVDNAVNQLLSYV